jgi:putative FmdB family regulatory protein
MQAAEKRIQKIVQATTAVFPGEEGEIMPLQDYYCTNCAKIYEIIVPLAQTDKKIKCPNCKRVLKKHISAPKTIKIN